MASIMNTTHHLPEAHVVAFVDVLGFRALLQRMTMEQETYLLVKNVLREIAQDHAEHYRRLQEYERRGQSEDRLFPWLKIQMSQFSDNVVLSKPINPREPKISAEIITHLTSRFAARLIRTGILVRGGISQGWLYHEGNVIFGEGLVSAYELENNVARVPRIVVADDVVAYISESYRNDNLLRDSDGLWFIDVFSQLWSGKHVAFPDPDQFNEVRRFLKDALEQITHASPDLKAKYRWIANQFNHCG